jgi:hypothetical protein
MKKIFIFANLFFTFAFQSFGQATVSLEQKINQADLVIEGKVVNQTAFLENDQIFTLNEVIVYKLFKGNYTGKYISVVTEGGRYGDRETSCDHCLGFSKGETGVFLANEKPISFGQDRRYTIFLGTEGFYRYFTLKEQLVAATHQEIYEDRTLLHRKLEKQVGQSHAVIALTEDELD